MRTLLLALLASVLTSGCISYTARGVRHHVILGFGVVTVDTNKPTVTVVKSATVGIGASSFPVRRCTVGFSKDTAAVVDTNQNVVIEIK